MGNVGRFRAVKTVAMAICSSIVLLLAATTTYAVESRTDVWSVCTSTTDGLVTRKGDEVTVDLSKASAGDFYFRTGAMNACIGQIRILRVVYSDSQRTSKVTVEKRAFWDQLLEEISFAQGIDELVIKDEAFAVVHERSAAEKNNRVAAGDRATLKSITFPSTINKLEIGAGAFRQAIGHDRFVLSEIRFPARAKTFSIGASAFEQICTLTNDCNRNYGGSTSELKRLHFPEGITSLNIGEGAFRIITTGKAGFEEIKFPTTLKELNIGNSAFQITSVGNRLQSLVFPPGIEKLSVGTNAFQEISGIGGGWPMSLQSVRLPENLNELSIGDSAFNTYTTSAASNGFFQSLIIPTAFIEKVTLGRNITRATGPNKNDFHWVWHGEPGTSKSLWKTAEEYHVAGFYPIEFGNVPRGHIELKDTVVKAEEGKLKGWVFPSDANVWSAPGTSGHFSGGVLPPDSYSMALPTTGYMPGFYLSGWCDQIIGTGGNATCTGQKYEPGQHINYKNREKPDVFYALWNEQELDKYATTYMVSTTAAEPNGKDSVPISILVKDKNGNPYMDLSPDVINFFAQALKLRYEETPGSSLPEITFSDIEVDEHNPGTLLYRATSTKSGRAEIRIKADLGLGGNELAASGNTIAVFSGGEINNVTYTVDEAIALPGEEQVDVDILFQDSNGVAFPVTQEFVEGTQLGLDSELVPGKDDPGATISALSVDLSRVGHVKAAVSAQKEGQVKINARWFLPVPILPSGNIYATFGEDDSNKEEQSFFVTNRQDVFANGTDEQTLSVILKDSTGEPIKNAATELSVLAADETGKPIDLGIGRIAYLDGAYSAPITSSVSGAFTITVLYQGRGVVPQVNDGGIILNTTTFKEMPARMSLSNAVSSISSEKYRAGTPVTFTYLIRNEGETALFGIDINQLQFTGMDDSGKPVPPESLPLKCDDEPAEGLAPTAQMKCFVEYTLTQRDVDNAFRTQPGPLRNLVSASAHTGMGTLLTSNSASAMIESKPNVGMELQIDVDEIAPGKFEAGTQVDFNLTALNSGLVSLYDSEIEIENFTGKQSLSPLSCSSDNLLLPKGRLTCSSKYILTQDDVDSSALYLSAKAKGNYGAQNGYTTSDSKEITITGTNNAAIALKMTGDIPSGYALGNSIDYSYEVRNIGQVSLRDINIEGINFTGSNLIPTPKCQETIIAPGGSTKCSASYTLTQADVDQGVVQNVARSWGAPVNGLPVVFSEINSVESKSDLQPLLEITTIAHKNGESSGETIEYEYTVVNAGPITLDDVEVHLDEISFSGDSPFEVSCPETPNALAPNTTIKCSGTYVLAQNDVDTGAVSATVTAKAMAQGAEITSAPSTTIVTLTPKQGILPTSSVIEVDADSFTSGNTITIPITTKNIGQTTLSNVQTYFIDFGGKRELPQIECPLEPTDLFAPGSTVECSAKYTLSQKDVDQGGFQFVLQAAANGPHEEAIESVPTTGAIRGQTNLSLTAQMQTTNLEKEDFKAGAPTTFTIAITNDGNVTAEQLTISEAEFSGSTFLDSFECESTKLAPGAKTTCRTDYSLTQADIDNGGISLANTISAKSMLGEETHRLVSTSLHGTPVLSLGLSAKVTRDTQTPEDPLKTGEKVTFTYLLKNTGNGTLDSPHLDLSGFSGAGALQDTSCSTVEITLSPGKTAECATAYTVTQKDLETGFISSFALANMKWLGHQEATPTVSATARLDLKPEPTIGLTGQVALAGSKFAAGEELLFSWKVTNLGPVRLDNILLEQDLGRGSCPDPGFMLEVGDSVTCTYTHTLTQQEVDTGFVAINGQAAASVVGIPSNQGRSEVLRLTFVPEATQKNSALSLKKTVSSIAPADFKEGSLLNYQFVVQNEGDVTLTGVEVKEVDFSGVGIPIAVHCPSAKDLGPGENMECTGTYRLTQKDVDGKSITNSAVANATAWGERVSSSIATAELTVDPLAGIRLTKSVREEVTTDFRVGTEIVYTFDVENSGNASLEGIGIVEDEFSGSGKMGDVVCPDAALHLLPGEKVTCMARYAITEQDIKSGALLNTATANASLADGALVRSMPAIHFLEIDASEESPIQENLSTTGAVSSRFLLCLALVATLGSLCLTRSKYKRSI